MYIFIPVLVNARLLLSPAAPADRARRKTMSVRDRITSLQQAAPNTARPNIAAAFHATTEQAPCWGRLQCDGLREKNIGRQVDLIGQETVVHCPCDHSCGSCNLPCTPRALQPHACRSWLRTDRT